jgi:hypothetical protein
MAHIFTGIVLLLTALILYSIDRFHPYVDFMSSFTEKGFKRLVGGLSIVGVLLLGFGIYSYLTYIPPFIKIEVDGTGYFVDGDIGNVGYIQKETEAYQVGEEMTILFVLWEAQKDLNIYMEDEAGEVYHLSKEIKQPQNDFTEQINKKLDSIGVYEVPFTFEKAGNWSVKIKENDRKIGSFELKVHQ